MDPENSSHLELPFHEYTLSTLECSCIHTTRWSSNLSSKVDLHHAIEFRTLCGANLVTYPLELWWNQTLKLHRVVRALVCAHTRGKISYRNTYDL